MNTGGDSLFPMDDGFDDGFMGGGPFGSFSDQDNFGSKPKRSKKKKPKSSRSKRRRRGILGWLFGKKDEEDDEDETPAPTPPEQPGEESNPVEAEYAEENFVSFKVTKHLDP